MKIKLIIILLMSIFLVFSCQFHKDISGNYIFQHYDTFRTLELRKDQSYTYMAGAGLHIVNSEGRWTWVDKKHIALSSAEQPKSVVEEQSLPAKDSLYLIVVDTAGLMSYGFPIIIILEKENGEQEVLSSSVTDYYFPDSNTISKIEIYYNGFKQFEYLVKDGTKNYFIIKTLLRDDPYRYFEAERFKVKRNKLLNKESGNKYRK